MATIILVLVSENLVNANFLTPYLSNTSYPRKMLKTRKTIPSWKCSVATYHRLGECDASCLQLRDLHQGKKQWPRERYFSYVSIFHWKMIHLSTQLDDLKFLLLQNCRSKLLRQSSSEVIIIKINEKTLLSFNVYLFGLTQMLKWW